MNLIINGLTMLLVFIGIGSNKLAPPLDILYQVSSIGYTYFLYICFMNSNKEFLYNHFLTRENFKQFISLCLCFDILYLYIKNRHYKLKLLLFILTYMICGSCAFGVFWFSNIFVGIIYPYIKISYNFLVRTSESEQVIQTNFIELAESLFVLINSYIIYLLFTNYKTI